MEYSRIPKTAKCEGWKRSAKCADLPRELFFPDDYHGSKVARNVCVGCPVAQHCLDYALAHSIEYGVWGGCSQRRIQRILRGLEPRPTLAGSRDVYDDLRDEVTGGDETLVLTQADIPAGDMLIG